MIRAEHIAETLRLRIAAGTYDLRQFPSERDLVNELGGSYLTVRKAVQQLLAEGVLVRRDRGRAEPIRIDQRPVIAFIAPDWPAPWTLQLRLAMQRATEEAGLAFRTQRYLHWDDPCIGEALARSVGVLFALLAEDLPDRVSLTLQESRARVMVMGTDIGVPGLHAFDYLPALAVRLALNHLAGQGHRRIAVFNVQPHDHIIRTRLDEAAAWSRQHPDLAVEVIGTAVASGQPVISAARIQAQAWLAKGRATAVLALTLPAAMGMARAAADVGRTGPAMPAIVTIDGEGLAPDLVPSISSVDCHLADLERILAGAVTWMAGGTWTGPLVVTCPPRLQVRESSAEPTLAYEPKIKKSEIKCSDPHRRPRLAD